MIVYELEHTQHRKCCVRYVTDRIIISGTGASPVKYV